jgi:hypothetical protein
MHRGAVFALGALTVLAASSPAQAQNLPRDLFGVITSPMRAIIGTVDRIGRGINRRQPVARPRATVPQSASRPRSGAPVAAAAGAAGAAASATAAAPSTDPRSASLSSAEQARQRRGQEPQPEVYRPQIVPSQLGLAVPVTWPSAYDDVVGFALWPNSYDRRLRAHGIGDVLASIFAPPGISARVARASGVSQTAADWPGRQIELAIKTTPAQRAAIDKLRAAVSAATASIRIACRPDALQTPVARMRALQNHLWTVQEAAILLRAPLAEFFDSLSEEQKEKFIFAAKNTDPRASAAQAATARQASADQQAAAAQPAVADGDPSKAADAGAASIPPEVARMCGMPLSREWPVMQIAQAVRPTEIQRASLDAVQKSAFEMGQLLMASCMTPPPATPVERLDAATDRLTAVIFAAANVAIALNDFYGQLDDRQRARFDTLSY